MASKDYSKYELYDLLMDSSFKQWALNNGTDTEADTHWQNVMRIYPQKREMILQAREMVRGLGNARAVNATRKQAFLQIVPKQLSWTGWIDLTY